MTTRVWLIGGSGVLLILALLLPEQSALFIGAAAGWAFIVLYLFRSRERMEYQQAIRHMRRGEYQQAITIMATLLDAEPNSVDHRQFRAQLYRLAGDLPGAAVDYKWMTDHDLGSVPGHIGLAEIALQNGDYDQAREHALAAQKQDRSWMAAYDLGLIEDHQGSAEAAVKHLETAVASGVPDSRHRLLARLWLARNYHHLGRNNEAEAQIALLRKEKKGLREWRVIFENEQGAVLRDLFEHDVQLAQQLIESNATLEIFDI